MYSGILLSVHFEHVMPLDEALEHVSFASLEETGEWPQIELMQPAASQVGGRDDPSGANRPANRRERRSHSLRYCWPAD